MTENMMVSSIFCAVILIALVFGINRGRRRAESQTQEVFKRQDEGQKVLREIAAQQTETNRLLRELIEEQKKK